MADDAAQGAGQPPSSTKAESPKASKQAVRPKKPRFKKGPPQFQGQFVPHRARRVNDYKTPGPGSYNSTSCVGSQVLSKNGTEKAYSFGQAPKRQFNKQYYSAEHQIKILPGAQVTANVDFRAPGRWEFQGGPKTLDMPESGKSASPGFKFSSDNSTRLDITKWKVINGFLMRDSDLDGTPNVDYTAADSMQTSFGRKQWAADSPTFAFGTGTREQRQKKQLHTTKFE